MGGEGPAVNPTHVRVRYCIQADGAGQQDRKPELPTYKVYGYDVTHKDGTIAVCDASVIRQHTSDGPFRGSFQAQKMGHRYQPVKVLGHGSFGRAVMCRDRYNDDRLVVKAHLNKLRHADTAAFFTRVAKHVCTRVNELKGPLVPFDQVTKGMEVEINFKDSVQAQRDPKGKELRVTVARRLKGVVTKIAKEIRMDAEFHEHYSHGNCSKAYVSPSSYTHAFAARLTRDEWQPRLEWVLVVGVRAHSGRSRIGAIFQGYRGDLPVLKD
eukprot:gene23702-37421_t